MTGIKCKKASLGFSPNLAKIFMSIHTIYTNKTILNTREAKPSTILEPNAKAIGANQTKLGACAMLA